MSETENPESKDQAVDVEAPAEVAPYIIESKYYFDEQGRKLTENVLLSGTRPDEHPRFLGFATLTANCPQPIGEVEGEFGFEIKAETIEEAFEKMTAALEAEKPEQMEKFKATLSERIAELREQTEQIVTAQEMDLQGLQMPGQGPNGTSGLRIHRSG